MPIYTSECRKCGEVRDYFRHVEDRNTTPMCCGSASVKILTPTHVLLDLPGYQSPVTGRWIEGRRERREDLKRTGSRPWEGMEQEQKEAARRQAYEDKKIDQALTVAVEKAYMAIDPERRKLLD